jgi:hypothetical protein
LIAVGLAAIGSASLPVPAAPSASLKEASVTCDVSDVRSLLGRIGKRIDSGFGPPERDDIAARVESMKVDDELTRDLSVKAGGAEIAFTVHVVMGPDDTPRISFFTALDLAIDIQQDMNGFLDERDAR